MQSLNPLSQPVESLRQSQLVKWFDAEPAEDFQQLLQSKIAVATAEFMNTHLANAYAYVSTEKLTPECNENLRQIARWQLCLDLFRAISDEVTKKQSDNTAIELTTVIETNLWTQTQQK
jgi:hypothetical protein